MTSIAIDRLDGLSAATAMKGPCRVATTAAITLAGEQAIDGVAVVEGDRVLVKDQADQTANGIYVADTGNWARAKDFSRNRDVQKGTRVYVTDGTGAGDYTVTTSNPVQIGTSNLVFAIAAYQPLDADLTAIAALADPNADRILFWDDSAGAYVYLSLAPGLVISGTELRNLEVWGVALSDETTAITTGTAKASFSIPYQFKVVGAYVTLNTVSSSGTPTFDVNEGGSSILGTKIVIDVSELTGGSAGYQGTAAGAATITDDTIAAFAQITWDIDTAGTGARGAKGYLVGYRNS